MFLLLGMPHTPCTHLFLLCPANTFLKPGISLDYRLPHTCVGASPWCCHYTLCSALTPLYYCLFPCSSWPYLSFLRAETVCHHHCIPHYWCSAWDVVYTQQMLKEWMSPTNQGQHTPVHSGNCSLTLSTLTLPKALFFWAVCGCWRALDNAELFLKCLIVAKHWVMLPSPPPGYACKNCFHQGWALTLPCSSSSPALGEEQASMCRLLSSAQLPGAGPSAACDSGWGERGEWPVQGRECGVSSSLVSFSALTVWQSSASLLPTSCLLFQFFVMLCFIQVLVLFQLLPPSTLLGELLLCFCYLCVCFALLPMPPRIFMLHKTAAAKNRNKNKKC